MFTSRTLTGNTLYEQLNPCFRMVDFADSSAVVTVSHYLRLAWNFVPDATYSCDEVGIGRFMRETQAESKLAESDVVVMDPDVTEDATEEEQENLVLANVERSRDVVKQEKDDGGLEDEISNIEGETVEANTTPDSDQEEENRDLYILSDWQLALLAFWNHNYYDVMQFLPQIGMGIGHFHPSSHSSLLIPFPSQTRSTSLLIPDSSPLPKTNPANPPQQPVLTHTFSTNTLLIPAYLSPGVTLRMTTSSNIPPNTSSSPHDILGTFSASNKTEIWWLRQGVEVSFYLDFDPASPSLPLSHKNNNKVAAVLAVGVLCDAMHEVCYLPVFSFQMTERCRMLSD